MPRQGAALLQGIAVCGHCGLHMQLSYSGPQGQYPTYVCRADPAGSAYCQAVRAPLVDAEIERLVLAALAPDQIALALAALEALEQDERRLAQEWRRRVERAHYEAERARRQYEAVEPENRLVARTLERQWEEALRAAERVEQEQHAWQQQQARAVSAEEREALVALGADLPRVWQAPSTTAADRKQVVRLIIQEVRLDQRRRRGQLWLQIHWQTGATSEHWLVRPVGNYDGLADLAGLEQRVRALHAEGGLDEEIAVALNAEGFRTAHGRPFSVPVVRRLRQRWGLATVNPRGPLPERWEDGSYSIDGVAKALGVYPGTVAKWLHNGRLHGAQRAPHAPWHIAVTAEELADLQAYLRRIRPQQRKAS